MKKPKPISHPKEDIRHLEAFQYYYSLGDDRTLEKVAEKLKLSVDTLKRWSSKYKWVSRISELDEVVKQKMQKDLINDIKRQRRNNLNIVIAMLNHAINDIKEGKLKPKDAGDIEKLIKLHNLLIGDVTERSGTELSPEEKQNQFAEFEKELGI